MGFRINYVEEINFLLMEKRTDNDIQTTLNIPEHKFKKIADKFNWALRKIYDDYREKDTKMFHILLSLQNYFDMKWLVTNVLNENNKKIVTKEMQEEYNITKSSDKKARKKNGADKKKKRRSKKS